jgi:hypothetical protein
MILEMIGFLLVVSKVIEFVEVFFVFIIESLFTLLFYKEGKEDFYDLVVIT